MSGQGDGYRIMLSGFESEAEKNHMAKAIVKLNGTYSCNPANSQAYINSCTHVVCKKPSRSEKYLAACAAGKWVLTHHFIEDSIKKKQWVQEKDYEWGIILSPKYSSTLQMSPRRWRKRISVQHHGLPFLGWKVGLVMKNSFVQAYSRILKAGGGETVDVTSWYSADADPTVSKDHVQALLTHVFVTPKFSSRISKSRTDDIPHLRAEFLAMYLLSDPPPSVEEYSLFKESDPKSTAKEKHKVSPQASTPKTPPKKSSPAQTKEKTATESQSPGNPLTSPNIPSDNLGKLALSPAKESGGKLPLSPAKESGPAKPSAPASPAPENKQPPNKPLPASLLAKSSVVFSPAKKSGTALHPGAATGQAKQQILQRGAFTTIGTPQSIKLAGSRATVADVKEGSTAGATNTGTPSPQTGQTKQPALLKSAFTTLGAPQVVNLSGARSAVTGPKDKTATSSNKTDAALPQKKFQPLNDVPTISLGPKRNTNVDPHVKKTAASDAATKRHFSEDFFRRNHAILEDFAARKKQLMTSYGILQDLINVDNESLESYKDRKARPFSREVMCELEAGLEFNYRSEHFLKEISNRLSSSVYPPPEVLFVIMKVILLDSADRNLSDCARGLLDKILELHPSQAPDIKAEKLYHKAFSVVTAPDTDETSHLMLAVGDMLSRYNAEDWKFWCSRDQTLGTLWTFYSRVFNIAIKSATPSYDEIGVKQEAPTEEKIENAGLLCQFLTDLVVNDYKEVLLRKTYPAHSPMIKCLIADLLWPTMTGMEPWYRRPSANLANLISLFVKATEAYVSYLNADTDNESVESGISEGSEDENLYDPLDNSQKVLEELSRLVTVTASWCVQCDLRDRERGKRTSSRTLEHELVSVLRVELEEKSLEVLKEALERLTPKLRLKVTVALIQHTCSDALVRERAKQFEDLSLEVITSRYMQMIPSMQDGEENDKTFSRGHGSSSLPRGELSSQDSNESGNVSKTSGDKINKRNHKGETPLHVACMSNRPDNVRALLKQPGIDPNATDYAGWTPLGEACNHGHIECVRALLTLTVKKDPPDPEQGGESSELSKIPPLEIDLTLCPSEGQTPLHDALGNDHLEIACLLIRKGGVGVLDKVDFEGRTPLDYCMTEAARSSMIEYACKIAVKARKRRLLAAGEQSNQEPMKLASAEEYDRVLPRNSIRNSDVWRERVNWLFNVVYLLLCTYVTSSDLVNACMSLELEKENDFSNPNSPSPTKHKPSHDVRKNDDVTGKSTEKPANFAASPTGGFSGTDLERYANDIMYCLSWKECWDTYLTHIRRLLGGNDDTVADVIADTINPIPIDLLPAPIIPDT